MLPQQIENYLEQQTLILEHIKKAGAQATIALSDDFLDYNSHNYPLLLMGLK